MLHVDKAQLFLSFNLILRNVFTATLTFWKCCGRVTEAAYMNFISTDISKPFSISFLTSVIEKMQRGRGIRSCREQWHRQSINEKVTFPKYCTIFSVFRKKFLQLHANFSTTLSLTLYTAKKGCDIPAGNGKTGPFFAVYHVVVCLWTIDLVFQHCCVVRKFTTCQATTREV